MVNFTFVTHKGARPERSELVKSHVMRESQRRRREAKRRRNHITSDGEQPSIPTPHQSGEDTQLTFQSSPLVQFPHTLNPVTTKEDVVAILTPSSAFDTPPHSRPSALSSSYRPDTECPGPDGIFGLWASPQDLGLWDAELNASYDTPPDDVFAESDESLYTALDSHFQNESEFFSDDPNAAEDRTEHILIRQPAVLYPTFLGGSTPSDATWLSQRLYERVVELTCHYTSALYIERSGLPAVNPVIYWQEKSLVDVKILLSCALFYSAYRDVVRGLPVNDHHYFKDRFLRLINLALEDPVAAISDSNIAAVISMCMYENVRGTPLAVVHLKELRQMIDMRGGINNLPTDQGQHISEMALLQDMMHASCSNVPPVMFDIFPPILRDTRRLGLESWYPQSPLRVLNDTGFLRPTLEPQSSFEILKDAFDSFEMLCIKAFDPETASDEAEIFKIRLDEIWTRLEKCEANMGDEVPPTNKERAEYAIRVAARIHFRAVTLKIQHEDEVNRDDLMALHGILRKIDLGFWKVAHYVYLWVLLTGGAASCKHSNVRPYFVSEIMRLGLSIGLFDWQSFRQTMGNFLWLQHFLRREAFSLPRA